MKKRGLIIIFLILMALLASCSNDFTGAGSGQLGAYKVKIDSYTLTKDSDGNDAVIVTYKWRNNSKAETSFITAISDKVYQNGVECQKTIIMNNNEYQGANAVKNVKRGESMTLQLAYALQDTKTPLDVELKEVANTASDAPVVKHTFELA